MSALGRSTLIRWRKTPVAFIEEVLRDPETGKPFVLLDAERAFLKYAYRTDSRGRLLYPEQLYSCPKKSGKSAFAAMHLLTTTLLFGGKFAEAYAIANDFEQAQGRVFQAAKRICEASPLLKRGCNITQTRIEFPQAGAVIQVIGSDYAGAAGANPVISSFDELWGYTSERSRRLWDEMVPSPVRKISLRLVTTYAGFDGESVLLEELYKRGKAQPLVGTDLHAGDGLLMLWSHVPIAPWQDAQWLEDMRRSMRPSQYLREVENQFSSTESAFIDMAAWDACVHPDLTRPVVDQSMQIFVGVDASVKHDSTAVVAVAFDAHGRVRVVFHRVFQPSPDEPLDFEATIEATVLDLTTRFAVRKVLFDPYQMQAVAQRLRARGVRIEEFPQTSANLTAASQNLYELIQGRNLAVYYDADMRLAVSRAVAKETARGWRITKEKATHKIDTVVALGMACWAATHQHVVKPVPIVGPYIVNRHGEVLADPAAIVRPQPLPPRPIVPPCPAHPTPQQLREHQAALAAAHGQGVPPTRGLGELPAHYVSPVFDAGPDELHWASARRWSPRPDW